MRSSAFSSPANSVAAGWIPTRAEMSDIMNISTTWFEHLSYRERKYSDPFEHHSDQNVWGCRNRKCYDSFEHLSYQDL